MHKLKMTLQDVYAIFDSIVPDEYGCHNFPSKRIPPGYYRAVKINGKVFKAHRVALERKLKRPIKPGFQALHTCDWKSCVNPDHLYEGTFKDNIHDIMIRNPEAWAHTNPLTRKKMSKARKTNWQDPEFREKMSKIRKAKWQDPKYRKMMLDARNTGWKKKPEP